jgi:transcriptional regulator with XRE-family HTH domain
VRLRAVREATGLTQLQFLPLLNEAAARLGVRAYAQSTLSRLETGLQEATFDDVAVFASVDPERRGKLWLAWNEQTDSTLGKRAPVATGYTKLSSADKAAKKKGA